jgi:apolipoprotein N-acyltransferase
MALDRRVREDASGRAMFGTGYVFGFVFFLAGIHWIALLSDYAITVPWLKYLAWVVAAAYLALFPALATWLSGWLTRRAGVPLAASFPLVMLAIEELRASGELGFPWFQPGYSQHAYVPLIQMASLGSVSLVTLWLLFLNVLIWRAITGPARLRPAIGAVLIWLLPWCWGLRMMAALPPDAKPAIAVAMIQADIPGEKKWSGLHQQEILDTFLRLSGDAAATRPRPALVIWPETATGSYLRNDLGQSMQVSAFAQRESIPVFSGFPFQRWTDDGRVEHVNAAGLFGSPRGLGLVYAKRHLVPAGERMPFQWLFPALGKLELGQAEWTPGRGTVLFPSEAGPFSCLVCFESIFPDLARADVRAGARWLVNITNDEWFGNSPALYQHAAMAPFRAVENHVPLVRCANTGITMVTDSFGREVARLPVWQAGILSVPLPPAARPTLFTRAGDWPGLLDVIVVAGMMLIAARRALTLRSRPA